MIIVCVMVLGGLGILAWWTRGPDEDIFTRMGSFFYEVIELRRNTLPQDIRVKKNLERLYPTESPETLHREYYVQKWSLVLKVLAAGTMLCLLIQINNLVNGGVINELFREEPGGGEKNFVLEAMVGEERQELTIHLEERYLQKGEIEELLQGCIKQLEQQLAEDYTEEALPESVEGYPFEITWRKAKPGEWVGYFYYGEEMYTHTFMTGVSQTTPKETLEEKLLQAVERQNSLSRFEKVFELPDELDGKRIIWKEVKEDYSGIVVLLMFLTAVGVYFLKDKDLHDEWLKKRVHMKMSYPIVLNKFVLFMEAGLTVRGSFMRMATFDTKREGDLPESEIYQEIRYSCYELNAGVSEGLVYERFGKRTGLEEYTRFATLLTQNLKKGNATLLDRLREESQRARSENVHIRKKLGEEAQTKLLLPMVLMMTVVMLLVMVPAFSAF